MPRFRDVLDNRRLAAQRLQMRREGEETATGDAASFKAGAQSIGTIIGTAVGAKYGNPALGASVGSAAGSQVGDLGGALIEDRPGEAALTLAGVPGIVQDAGGLREKRVPPQASTPETKDDNILTAIRNAKLPGAGSAIQEKKPPGSDSAPFRYA